MHASFSFETEHIQEDEYAQSTIEIAEVAADWSRCRLKDLLGMITICRIRIYLRDEEKNICGAHEGRYAQ